MPEAGQILALVADADQADTAWRGVEEWAEARYGRPPSVESMLFLIGAHARRGAMPQRLKKEAKQDLIMEGTHAALSTLGVYRRTETGWDRVRALPVLSEGQQERLLRIAIARYLEQSLGPNS